MKAAHPERSDRRHAPTALSPLAYRGGVRVTGGAFADRIADAAETYLAMHPDDVLHGFRRRAGLPHPGRGLTGWSSVDTQPTFGQWVSGLARLGATSGVNELSERAIELVEGWAQTLGDDGDAHMGVYPYEKLVCGLVDTALYAEHPPALELLARVTDWAARTFDRTRHTPHAANFAGGPRATHEWYTLPENLYRGWMIGGDRSLRDFAEMWHYNAYWDRFTQRPAPGEAWDVPTWLHAYSHVNTFASATAAYQVTGDATLLDIACNAHDYVTTTQTYATGGYGPSEFTLPEDGTLGRALEWRTDTAEIVCGSWAAFKLTSAVVEATGEARFLDWAETLAYSGIGAVTPVQPSGRSPYYHDYRLGMATKLPHWEDWPCCSGTYIQTIAHLADLIYWQAADGLAVALYIPSSLETTINGTAVRLTQHTDFPVDDETTLRIDPETPTPFSLRLRVPGWTRGMSISVNGSPADVEASPSTWAAIEREWHPGDIVTVQLGAGLRVLPVDRWHPNRVAVAHGPVVLAQHADWTAPLSLPTPWPMVDLEDAFRREDGLRYVPLGTGTARLRPGEYVPLSDIPERFPYRVYTDLDSPRII